MCCESLRCWRVFAWIYKQRKQAFLLEHYLVKSNVASVGCPEDGSQEVREQKALHDVYYAYINEVHEVVFLEHLRVAQQTLITVCEIFFAL